MEASKHFIKTYITQPEPRAEGGEQWGQWGGQSAEGGGGGEGVEGGEGGGGGGGLGTHWTPLNTSLITRTKGRGTRWDNGRGVKAGEQWSSGVDKALRAVGAVAARSGQWQRPEPSAAKWGQWQRSGGGREGGW